MSIKIRFDAAHNPEQPTLVLAKKNGDKIGRINAKEVEVTDNMNDASEMSFTVYKYVDGKKDALWDEITNFRLVYCVEWDKWFELTVEIDESDDTVKTVSCVLLGQAELSQIMLYNVEINTETDIEREEYDSEYPTILYRDNHTEASLLHRVLEKAPHYSIAHVDDSLKKLSYVREFSFDDTSIYDALQDVSEEFDCLFVFDSDSNDSGGIRRTISVYDLESTCNNEDCGYRGVFTGKCPKCDGMDIYEGYGEDTGIFVTADEIADNLSLSVDTDNVKNCFKLIGGDDMMNATIRNCNPNGSDYIWYISNEIKKDMSEELVSKIASYDEKYAEYYDVKNYAEQLDANAVDEYNAIVNKYAVFLNGYLNTSTDEDNPVEYDKDAYKDYLIPKDIIGYRSVMKIYYDAIDMAIFLKSAMMPTVDISKPKIEDEAAKLTADSLSPVATENERILKALTVYTANNIVLSMVKAIVDSRFKVEVSSSSLARNDDGTCTWKGSFLLTDYSDKNSTATTGVIEVKVNADYEQFVKQKIDKALSKDDTDDMSITGLFKKEVVKDADGSLSGDFVDEIKKYGLARLTSFHDACQSCIDILVEQGIADNQTWSQGSVDETVYDNLYLPYRNKLAALELEMSERQSDIDVVAGVYNENGGLEKKGLQNYVEDLVESIQSDLDFQKHLGNELWLEFCSFRREDKYDNDNFVSDGLNNAELIERANEFIQTAQEEIYKSSELQTSISATLRNLLVIPKFISLVGDFETGNWIRVLVDDVVYKLRLISYGIDYDDLDNVSVEFADAVKVNSSVRSVKDVLTQASSMATSYSSVRRQAKKGSESNFVLNGWFDNGLDVTNTKIIGGADGQTQSWDEHGMLFRKFDEVSNDYEPEQMKIINSTMAITDDNWQTTKTAVGKYYYTNSKGEQEIGYGINAETIVGKLMLGETLAFQNESGTMSFDENGFVIKHGGNHTMTFNENGLVADDGTYEVKIDPSAESIINIKNGDNNLFSIGNDGRLLITGNIVASSINVEDAAAEGNIAGFSDVAISGSYTDLSNKPKYGDLEGTPSLAIVATSGKYTDLTGRPSLATVATSGKYTDLTGKPSLKTVATSGKYTDLIGNTSEAGKLLYVDTDGSVTTLTIASLKTLLGI